MNAKGLYLLLYSLALRTLSLSLLDMLSLLGLLVVFDVHHVY